MTFTTELFPTPSTPHHRKRIKERKQKQRESCWFILFNFLMKACGPLVLCEILQTLQQYCTCMHVYIMHKRVAAVFWVDERWMFSMWFSFRLIMYFYHIYWLSVAHIMFWHCCAVCIPHRLFILVQDEKNKVFCDLPLWHYLSFITVCVHLSVWCRLDITFNLNLSACSTKNELISISKTPHSLL